MYKRGLNATISMIFVILIDLVILYVFKLVIFSVIEKFKIALLENLSLNEIFGILIILYCLKFPFHRYSMTPDYVKEEIEKISIKEAFIDTISTKATKLLNLFEVWFIVKYLF